MVTKPINDDLVCMYHEDSQECEEILGSLPCLHIGELIYFPLECYEDLTQHLQDYVETKEYV